MHLPVIYADLLTMHDVRYPLLMKELEKATDPGHSDYKYIKEAVKAMNSVASVRDAGSVQFTHQSPGHQ